VIVPLSVMVSPSNHPEQIAEGNLDEGRR